MQRICDIKGSVNGKDTKFYKTWQDMFIRCYSPRELKRSPSYIGCSVDQRWQKLSIFKQWFDMNYVEGYHLDKDILVQGNKIYGPDTCCFVPVEVNALFVHKQRTNTSGFTGVRWDKDKSMWRAEMYRYNKYTFLGRFKTPQEANYAYVQAKTTHVRHVADEQYAAGRISSKVRDAIYRYDFSI